jgi:hypothetical protein
MVAFACHPSYLRSWDQKDQGTGHPGKKVQETPSQQKNLGMVLHTYHPSYGETCKYYDCSPYPLAQNTRPYLKTNQRKKGWGRAQVTEHILGNTRFWIQVPVLSTCRLNSHAQIHDFALCNSVGFGIPTRLGDQHHCLNPTTLSPPWKKTSPIPCHQPSTRCLPGMANSGHFM